MQATAPLLTRTAISAAFAFALAWAIIGRIDSVAVAPGKIISAGKAKVIQPAETAVVKRILVRDGQTVKAVQAFCLVRASTPVYARVTITRANAIPVKYE